MKIGRIKSSSNDVKVVLYFFVMSSHFVGIYFMTSNIFGLRFSLLGSYTASQILMVSVLKRVMHGDALIPR